MLIIGNGKALAAAIAVDVLMNCRLFRLLTALPLLLVRFGTLNELTALLRTIRAPTRRTAKKSPLPE
jgi:hypothetical protein